MNVIPTKQLESLPTLLLHWPNVPFLALSSFSYREVDPATAKWVELRLNSRARLLLSIDGAGCWVPEGSVVAASQAGG